ncbi:NAD(P)H:quinone oxidoreductase [Nonomuraea muscovyensis]|uniref:NAD(P)H dehydrogenase (Quinone) n=1 Tax=Nonomuraea muscovyensis TaxID=1124761 RepID=A0A7X0EWK5_9ACTN|nr:NAD(P)H:quinone oxidoreductase [Nonomuraea muscovyensis]MBB6346653.1 NAD(P)H dehydrogenase (quinone) [Nonomuraea muscovyensis]
MKFWNEDDTMTVNVAVIYYSSTGTVHALARAVAEGAEKAGATVRLRRVAELAPAHAVESDPAWQAHIERTADIPEAALDDLEWADAVLFGTPTRYGTVAAQLKQFIDTTGPLWQRGRLAGKVYGAFTAGATAHGGQESTLLSLGNVFYHWGGIIVPPGYTDPVQFRLGNPYGTSFVSAMGGEPGEVELEAAAHQGRRAAATAALLARSAA